MHKRILLACLFPASVILSACKPTVEVPWTLSEVEPVNSPTTSTTPSYRFYSDFYGTITYAGGCTSATTAAVSGVNQVTFNTLALGSYSACTIKVTTSAGKVSAPLAVSPFIVNSGSQTITQVTPVPAATSDTTPDYTFISSVAGAVTSTGSCTFAATSATANVNKTLTFNALADGTYSNCIIKVGTNSLAVSSFTVDTVKPVVAEVTKVPASTTLKTPSYTFSSTEAGTITYGGTAGCTSATTTAIAGNTTITFTALTAGTTYSCTITVKDAANNISTALTITPFTIVKANPLNDTGVTLCGNYPSNIDYLTTTAGTAVTAGTYAGLALTNVSGSGSGATATIEVVKAGSGWLTAGAITGGAGYVNGYYSNVPLTAATTTAKANITVSGGAVTTVTIIYGGSGYVTGGTVTTLNGSADIGGGTPTTAWSMAKTATSATANRIYATAITGTPTGYIDGNILSATNAAFTGLQLTVVTKNSNSLVCATAGATKTVSGVSNGNPVPQNQDALNGRDVATATDADGKAGLTYLKLGVSGAQLSIQDGVYTAADAGTEATGTKWSCVKDMVTNLVWEIKTDAATANYRDKDHTYSWYNNSGANTGGAIGTSNGGIASGTPTSPTPTGYDTEKYAADVNSATLTPTALCGYRDWRLPTAAELSSLRLLSNTAPAIDTNFFPNTKTTGNYWTSSPDAAASANAWTVSASTGVQSVVAKNSTATYVRLVRGGF